MAKKKKYYGYDETLEKLRKYCAYQERCHKDVRYKILEYNIYGDELEQIISELISENFLDEERFARAYARGKFRMNRWGRRKITMELKRKDISAYCIKKAMTEIDPEEYEECLTRLIEKKKASIRKPLKIYQLNREIYKYCYNKGYESDIISALLYEE